MKHDDSDQISRKNNPIFKNTQTPQMWFLLRENIRLAFSGYSDDWFH